MLKTIALILALVAPVAAGPYQGISLSTTTGKAIENISGSISLARSSVTFASYTITLDGATGKIDAGSITVTGASLFKNIGAGNYALTASTGMSMQTGQFLIGAGGYIQYPDGSISTTAVAGNFLSSTTAADLFVNVTGDAMTGQLTLAGSTLTVGGNAFSVGGSSFAVAGGSATVAYRMTAGSFSAGGSVGITTSCATGQVLTGVSVSGGIITGGSGCVLPGSGSGGVNWFIDNFLGQVNGSQTVFTLSQPPTTSSGVFVILDGLVQSGTSDYIFTPPQTITMTTAPAANSSSFYVQYTSGTSASATGDAVKTATQTWTGTNTFNNTIRYSSGATAGDVIRAIDSNGDMDWQAFTSNAAQITGNGQPTNQLTLNSSSVTLQGNTFNGANQLVKLDGSGALPAVSGANLTGLPGSGTGSFVKLRRTILQGITTFTPTTAIPLDNTIPQNNEGSEILTVSITPESTTNILTVYVQLTADIASGNPLIATLFQDLTANAMAASSQVAGTDQKTFGFNYSFVAGTTSATTIKLRAGSAGSIEAMNFNRISASFSLGGVITTSLIVVESRP